jgi:hypothetical protein
MRRNIHPDDLASSGQRRFGIGHRFEAVVPVEKTYNGNFVVRFSKAVIIDGGITCRIYIKETGGEVEFTIINPYLRKEHETIKEYICKRLGKKTFVIATVIRELGWTITSTEATSADIATIDERFFQQLTIQRVKANLGALPISQTLHDLSAMPGPFPVTLDDVIRIVTNDHQHRNSYALDCLAKKHDLHQPVYMTAKPRFGFLFYISDARAHHYIWELLDSHATYVWSFGKPAYTIASALMLTEQKIRKILAEGRIPYKREAKQVAASEQFLIIEHHILESLGTLDVLRWKNELDAIIAS